jgi:hypothetical protein
MIGTLSAALASFRAATEITKTALAARDDNLISTALRDMNDRFMDVQNECLALQEKHFLMAHEVRDLKEKVRGLESQTADFANYELYRTLRGGLTYRSKASIGANQEPVHLCANCVASGVKSFLQPDLDGWWLVCTEHGKVPSDVPDQTAKNMRKLARKLS